MSNLNNYKMSNKNKFNSILKHESGLKTLGSGFYKIGKLRGGFSFIEVIIASGLIGILLMASPQFYIAAQNLQAESKHKSIEQKISANINTIAGLKDSLLISQSFKSGPNYELKKCLTQAISYVPGSAPDCINNQSYPIFLYGPTSMPKNSSRTRILTRAFFGTDTEPSFYDTEGEPCDVPVKGECIYKVVGYFVPQCAVDSVSGSTFPSCDVPEVIKINYDISQMTFSETGQVQSTVVGNINSNIVLLDVAKITKLPVTTQTIKPIETTAPSTCRHHQERDDDDEYDFDKVTVHRFDDESDFAAASKYNYRYDNSNDDGNDSDGSGIKHTCKRTCPSNMFQNAYGECDCGKSEVYDKTIFDVSGSSGYACK